jgi:p-hydroxybenzoate 3-monooxygenase
LNLAVADVSVLAPALADYYETGRMERLHDYSDACLPRVWRAQRFSAWMTSALHRLPGMDNYRSRLQVAELEYVVHSSAAATSLAENYAGFPLAGSIAASERVYSATTSLRRRDNPPGVWSFRPGNEE